jgi:hypothetical protein
MIEKPTKEGDASFSAPLLPAVFTPEPKLRSRYPP